MEPSARICLDSWRGDGHIVGDLRDAIMRNPLTEVGWFEYHNDLKAKLLMVAITEATTR